MVSGTLFDRICDNSQKSRVHHTTLGNLIKNNHLSDIRRAGIILYTKYKKEILIGLGVDSVTHDLTDFGGGVLPSIDNNPIETAFREFHEETLGIFEDKLDKDYSKDFSKCYAIHDRTNVLIFIEIDYEPEDVCIAFNEEYHYRIQESNEAKGQNEIISERNKDLEDKNIEDKNYDGMNDISNINILEIIYNITHGFNTEFGGVIKCNPLEKKEKFEVCGITWIPLRSFKDAINNNERIYVNLRFLLQRAGNFEANL